MDDTRPNSRAAEYGLDDPPASISDLPPPDTKRWVVRRKASVVYAVETGLISLDEACDRYAISLEEFTSWQQLLERHGLGGLRVTRLGEYRSEETGQDV